MNLPQGINGFVIGLPDVSGPLDITNPSQCLWTNDKFCDHSLKWADDNIAEKLVEWVKAEERKSGRASLSCQFMYRDPNEPILKFKDMLLRERLYETCARVLVEPTRNDLIQPAPQCGGLAWDSVGLGRRG